MTDFNRHPLHRTSKYAVLAGDQPVVDQGDPQDQTWIAAGGDPRDAGRYVELISRNLTNSERLMVGLGWFDPGDIHLLHHHPEADEWYYITKGAGEFTIGDEVIRGGPGTAIFIPAGTPHRIDNDGGEILEILWGFDRAELREAGFIWDE